MRKVQNILNSAARMVLNKGKRTRIKELMEGCNWLYATELERYQSLVSLWKTLKHGRPKSMRTRLELDEDNLLMCERARLQIVDRSYRCRVTKYWNSLTGEVRDSVSLVSFKTRLKRWILLRRQEAGRHQEDRSVTEEDSEEDSDTDCDTE